MKKNEPVIMKHLGALPYDDDGMCYMDWGDGLYPYLYTDWREETMSWKTSCYVHAGLSGETRATIVEGPEAIEMMSAFMTNSFKNFPVGKSKMGLICSPKGNVQNHGLCMRTSENTIETHYIGDFYAYVESLGIYNAKVTFEPRYIYQLAGPRSLEILEHITKEDFHDLQFLCFRNTTVLGHTVRVVRMGMGGSLSYEIQAFDLEAGREVYDEILRVGKVYNIVRMGMNAYMCNHTENGFPQTALHFPGASVEDDEYVKWRIDTKGSFNKEWNVCRGSLSTEISDYYRNPFELGWEKCVKFDHEFQGREALEKIAQNHRQIVTLRWNPDDIMKVFQSLFLKDEVPYKDIRIPQDYNEMGNFCHIYHSDKVLKDGKMVGVSMWHTYTLYYRDLISMCSIDPEYAQIGTEVKVLWGDIGKRQIEIKATVERYPYLDLTANRDFDLNTIPRIEK